MAVWAEHILLENFTQCKPQLVSIPLNDSISVTTVGHPDDKQGKPKLEEPTPPWGRSPAGTVEGLQSTFSALAFTPTHQ